VEQAAYFLLASVIIGQSAFRCGIEVLKLREGVLHRLRPSHDSLVGVAYRGQHRHGFRWKDGLNHLELGLGAVLKLIEQNESVGTSVCPL
jgi:hypothetical protein